MIRIFLNFPVVKNDCIQQKYLKEGLCTEFEKNSNSHFGLSNCEQIFSFYFHQHLKNSSILPSDTLHTIWLFDFLLPMNGIHSIALRSSLLLMVQYNLAFWWFKFFYAPESKIIYLAVAICVCVCYQHNSKINNRITNFVILLWYHT